MIAFTLKDVPSLLQQGLSFHQQGALDQAFAFYEQASILAPNLSQPWHLMGVLQLQSNRFSAAHASLTKALTINPENPEILFALGNTELALQVYEAAADLFKQVLLYSPQQHDALNNLGHALLKSGNITEAIETYQQLLRIQNQDHDHNPNPDILLNIATCYQTLGDYDLSLDYINQSLQIKPSFSMAYFNRANVYKLLKRFDDAVESYKIAIKYQPDFSEAYHNLSTVLLLQGELLEGWKLFEWRWKSVQQPIFRHFDQPLWLGHESLMGKTILLHTEQGLGDTLQFVRYTSLVKSLGATVILEVESSLMILFEQLNGVDCLVKKGMPLPEFDYHCPLMSLPLAFKTTLSSIPKQMPYLFADLQKISAWRSIIEPSSRKKVGLVWSGGARVNHDHRNINFSDLYRLQDLSIDFYSLQKGFPAEAELTQPQNNWLRNPIINFTSLLNDFSDTAALVENLDLVITVDTSMAHLAGALNKPVWILNRYDHCWRWLMNREDSPWYPSARLYHQTKANDWESVIESLYRDLQKLDHKLL